MLIKHVFSDIPYARYNVAAWQHPDTDRVVLIGREVEQAAAFGEPDKGKLVLMEMDQDEQITHERVIWEPLFDGLQLEDPRALMLVDGSVVIGLTTVLKGQQGYVPFPSIVTVDSRLWRELLPPVTLIQTFGPGKNITPMDVETFLFRPDDPDYHHKLLIFRYKKMSPYRIQDLTFPKDLWWAQWRIGTTMSPLWVNSEQAIMMFHGISIEQGKYVYRLGKARLSKIEDCYTIAVDPQPFITPDLFLTEEGAPLVEELHPGERRVVYACGGLVKRHKSDLFSIYVNVGDRTTFEVSIPLKDLKAGLF